VRFNLILAFWKRLSQLEEIIGILEEIARIVVGKSSPNINYIYSIVYFKRRLWIPSNINLRKKILEFK
jgi:hypothetical protein